MEGSSVKSRNASDLEGLIELNATIKIIISNGYLLKGNSYRVSSGLIISVGYPGHFSWPCVHIWSRNVETRANKVPFEQLDREPKTRGRNWLILMWIKIISN